MNNVAPLLLGTAALGVPLQAGAAPGKTTGARPNIILVMADDMGYSDIGCYGGEIPTPNGKTAHGTSSATSSGAIPPCG